MRTSSLYALTAEICDRVLVDARPADAMIATFFRERAFLGSHDRRFISDTMYSLIRHKRRLEAVVEAANSVSGVPPLSGSIAMLGAFVCTGGAPRPADHDLGMAEAAKCELLHAVAFSQGCTDAEMDLSSATNAERIAFQHSFPDWLVHRFIEERGEVDAEALCAALNTQAPITLRANTLRTTIDACFRALNAEGLETGYGAISPTALRLGRRVNVFQSPHFKQGWFEMQDEGSQVVSLFTDPHPNWKVLDACAGAGGKALHLAALMQNKGEIFALVQNEYQDAELRRRIKRAGAQNIRVVKGTDPAVLENMAGTMNVVLIDAPCSGTGTIRRNPIAKWRLTENKIHAYAATQLSILEQYMGAVRPNGKLVYATCSVLKEENADVAATFLAAHPEFVVDARGTRFDGAQPLRTETGAIELLPHRHDTDGFFAAAFTRSA